jgi:hypothetical protein
MADGRWLAKLAIQTKTFERVATNRAETNNNTTRIDRRGAVNVRTLTTRRQPAGGAARLDDAPESSDPPEPSPVNGWRRGGELGKEEKSEGGKPSAESQDRCQRRGDGFILLASSPFLSVSASLPPTSGCCLRLKYSRLI